MHNNPPPRKHYPVALRKAASATCDAAQQMLNMLGHAGTVHRNDAVAKKLADTLYRFQLLTEKFTYRDRRSQALVRREFKRMDAEARAAASTSE